MLFAALEPPGFGGRAGKPLRLFFYRFGPGAGGGIRRAHFAGGEFYMDNLAVFPDYRRQGVGRALVQALVGFAQENGGVFLTLEVRPSNAYALALYGGLGFRAVGRRRGFYTRPVEDALLLRLDFV